MTASRSITPAATGCSCRSRISSFCPATARRRPRSQLDRLGGGAWQARKARHEAAHPRDGGRADQDRRRPRRCKDAPRLTPPDGLYDEFAARFPYDETEDQLNAIEAVLDDLASGRPMDRLVCGDVGFGKTEVALRAAFVAAMGGKQVAVVVPTTLLVAPALQDLLRALPRAAAQHRPGLALRARGRDEEAKEGLPTGTVDIVVGTHALLGKAISSRISACSSSTRSSISASTTRSG